MNGHPEVLTTIAAVTADAAGRLILSGRLDSAGVALVWTPALALAAGSRGELGVDCSAVTYLDGAGASLLVRLRQLCVETGRECALAGLAQDQAALLALYTAGLESLAAETSRPHISYLEQVGRFGVRMWRDVSDLVGFLGESSVALGRAMASPGLVRWKDVWSTCETAGVNAMPIIGLIGFLMGLIMAFQSAIPLKRFGADIFIPDMLGISMLRELGPLVTAILLAGRSGAAFAAEIGTMKVNEEVSALTTMGLDPLRFLAVPRVLAALFVTPILTIFFNLFAFIGGAFVVSSLGYTLTTYLTRLQASVTVGDIATGLIKAMVFSLLVAGIGCRSGLTTGTGASAVGASTTASVVAGLILIAVADGLFAVLFYAMGI